MADSNNFISDLSVIKYLRKFGTLLLKLRIKLSTRCKEKVRSVYLKNVILILLPTASYVAIISQYLSGRDFPAYGGGLFQMIAEGIRQNHYYLPSYIPLHLNGEIPLGYPPAGFYFIALVRDATGVSGQFIALYGSIAATGISLVAVALLTRELTGLWAAGSVSAAAVIVMPEVFKYHIIAAGIVRVLAFTIALMSISASVRIFKKNDRRFIPLTAVGFGVTILTHPIYAAFCGLSIFSVFIAYDRSLKGFQTGAVVAGAGGSIAAPWAFVIIKRHGFGLFLRASITQGILPQSIGEMGQEFLYWQVIINPPLVLNDIWIASLILGSVVVIILRRWVFPIWLVTTGLLINAGRFQYVITGVILGAAVVDLPKILNYELSERAGLFFTYTVVFLVLITGTIAGAVFAGTGLHNTPGEDQMNTIVDAEDRRAMDWVKSETRQNATFVVIGDANEWFPYLSERPTLTSVRGSEWLGVEMFRRQRQIARELAGASTADELHRTLTEYNLEPSYVYVPMGQYSEPFNEPTRQSPKMRASIYETSKYSIEYKNQGVVIVQYQPDSKISR